MEIEYLNTREVGILLTFDEKDVEQLKTSIFLNRHGLLGYWDMMEAIHEKTYFTSTFGKVAVFMTLTSSTRSLENKQNTLDKLDLRNNPPRFGAENEGLSEGDFYK
jgi:hypothetical protein